MYEKTDKNGFYRDVDTGAIINQDMVALEMYRKQKQKSREFESLKQKQNHIEDELAEIKNLLREALGQVNVK